MLQIIIIVLSVVADQLSKHFLVPVLLGMPNRTIPVIQDVFHLTYVENRGASFGMLQGAQVFFLIITAAALVAGAFFMIRTRKTQSVFLKISLSLVVGGAIGNFIDRIFLGYVRDLFDFSGFGFPWIFNVADACLVVGAILLGVYVIFIYKEEDGKTLAGHLRRNKDGKTKNADDQDTGES